MICFQFHLCRQRFSYLSCWCSLWSYKHDENLLLRCCLWFQSRYNFWFILIHFVLVVTFVYYIRKITLMRVFSQQIINLTDTNSLDTTSNDYILTLLVSNFRRWLWCWHTLGKRSIFVLFFFLHLNI